MNIPTGVPVTISDEAEAWATTMGLRADLERVLEHAVQEVPGLLRMRVVLVPPYDTGDEDHLVIEALHDAAGFATRADFEKSWCKWEIETFPPEVLRHFTLMPIKEPGHAG
jgi:hypothetical protein